MRIAILGNSGAIGGLFGRRLAEARQGVRLVDAMARLIRALEQRCVQQVAA